MRRERGYGRLDLMLTVAAMDSCFVLFCCFALVRTHQHGITGTVSRTITDPAFTTEASSNAANLVKVPQYGSSKITVIF